MGDQILEELNTIHAFTIYLGYAILTIFGHIRDFIDKYILGIKTNVTKEGYAPLTRDFEQFYRRRMYARIVDCFNRPIIGTAGGRIKVIDRNNSNKKTGIIHSDVINLSSYNYLGFAETGTSIEKEVLNTVNNIGISTCSSTMYGGKTYLHDKLEKEVAKFLSVEEAMVFGMGWGTNSTAIPALIGKGSLIISDSINHNSIVVGARASGAKIQTFPHNNIKILEKRIRNAIINGQPKTHRPWKKILIIVEGIYSMEGETCKLSEIVELKKKYKCYLYVDEAHSIGALGKNGRGITEYCNVNPKDIDILMGTFTKSFGAIGGYIAGSSKLISCIKKICASHIYSSGLSPPCVTQVLSAINIINSKEGKNRIKRLHDNANYMRETLRNKGLLVLGDSDSAVIPVIIGNPAKMAHFSREVLKRGLAVVIVGFPATPLLTSRVRFCLSSAQTKDDIDQAIAIITCVAKQTHLYYGKSILG